MSEQQYRIFQTQYKDDLKNLGCYVKIEILTENGPIYIPINAIITLKITERLDYFFYAGSLEFLDVESIIEQKLVNGNEDVNIKIGNTPENANDFKMRIWSITHKPLNVSLYSDRIIVLNLISQKTKENVKSHWVFKNMTISDEVKQIISSQLKMKPDVHDTISEKLYDKHDLNYVLPWVTPQEAIYHLRQYAVNASFNTTDYFVYQNHEKNTMCFHSLSELRSKKPKEEFVDSIEPKDFAKNCHLFIDKWVIDIDPGFAFYNSNKTKTAGYDYWHMKYVEKTDKFSDNFTKSKLPDNNGGFPILKIDEDNTNKLLIDYFLYESEPWCDAKSKNDLFLAHYKLLFGEFTTFPQKDRKPGDVIKMKILHSGDPDDLLRNKLFNGGALIWGITHIVYQSQYIQKVTFYKDRYYNASKGLVI